MRFFLRILAPSVGCLLAMTNGCTAPSPDRGGFASAAPAARTSAVVDTVRDADRTGRLDRANLQAMVELLMADDDLVRFTAIAGLEALTDRTEGYRFFDAPEVRYGAVLRWRSFALTAREGRSGILITPPPTAGEAAGSTSAEGSGS